MTGLHVVGVDPATGERSSCGPSTARFVDGPVADPIELTGFVLPGFVDAHCHVGYSTDRRRPTLDEAEEQARTNLHAGALALRDCGSPLDTRPLVGRDDLPVLIRAGRHIARTRRYIRELGVDLDDPAELPGEVARQLEYGDGWIKIVGDWIDRSIGDLAPLWPDDMLAEAVAVAHAGGARVTTHVFGEDALPGLLAAGVDCIEHGTGLTDDTIATAAANGRAPGPDGDQHRELPVVRRRRRQVPDLRQAHAGPARPQRRDDPARRWRPGSRCTPAPTPAASSSTAGSPTR